MQEGLWEFTLAVYARPGVETACLRLQEAGADVCLLLTALWLDRHGYHLDAQRLDQLVAQTQTWQQHVITPLRSLRQAWKLPALSDAALSRLREQVKALELAAEREQLIRLAALIEPWPTAAEKGRQEWLERLAPPAAAAADLARLTDAGRQVSR